MSNWIIENGECEVCSGQLATNGEEIWCIECATLHKRFKCNNEECFESLG